jgi:hypothetical protein
MNLADAEEDADEMLGHAELLGVEGWEPTYLVSSSSSETARLAPAMAS